MKTPAPRRFPVSLTRVGSARRRFAVAGIVLALAAVLPAAMLPGSRPKKWPANEARHSISIQREAKDPKQSALIAAAESAVPDAAALKKAIGDGPAPEGAAQWWYAESLGIRIPFAVTGEAVAYYKALVEGYRKQELERYSEPSSSLDYRAEVTRHAEFKLDGKTYGNVDVVTLTLVFSEHFAATVTEGMDFRKQRTVVFDADGKLLAVSGDGTTEAAILAQ